MQSSSRHGMWSSRTAFVLAATGSAVGLGNIWRFPYMTSDNGGGAFVLIYLACIAAVGLPILLAEIMIGRHGRMSPINSLGKVADENKASHGWKGIGWLGIVAGFVILSFYSVVAGWTLHYSWLYLKQLFGGAAITDPGATFGALLANPVELTAWHAVFMVLTLGVVAMGVEKGLERAVKFLMPALFILLLVLVGYGATTGHLGQAASFLFKPDFSEVDGSVFLQAMGQAFFSLSLGMCAMMTYGAYLPNGISIPKIGGMVVLADTGVALLAGLAIFPIVIAFGLDPAGGGPGLIFTSLPLAFNAMSFGIVYGLLFFGLLSMAAWTSSISLLEPATAYLVEKTDMSRKLAAVLVALGCWALGLASVLSFNVWSDVSIFGRGIMDFLEFIANDLMLPLGGMLIAIFAGWFMSRRISRDELDLSDTGYTIWLWLVRVVSPALVLVVLLRAFL
ncbi:sodium-dependent transporter [Alkalisalibacterium limincola]|uniref:Transporter n=1 Tax=Alkalisalibacterium limincola TaxID=2699169 RepID=A0A5C8KY13_9GAMM|nr:sodium-dependent transporter [Alkalisalibacterium limincola]TXK65696.1 sodium-dependent transporter [Alkalisalibacterium limincola]